MVESESDGTFSLCGKNSFLLWKLSGAFLGLSSAADAAWMAQALGAHTEPFGKEQEDQEQWQAKRKKWDRHFTGSALFIAPQMVFVQLSRTVAQLQVWELG